MQNRSAEAVRLMFPYQPKRNGDNSDNYLAQAAIISAFIEEMEKDLKTLKRLNDS